MSKMNTSLVGLKKESKETLELLGRNVQENFSEIINKANSVATILSGKDKNDITTTATNNVKTIADVTSEMISELKAVVDESMKTVYTIGENKNSAGMQEFATDVKAYYAALELPKFNEPITAVGGDALTQDDTVRLVEALKATIQTAADNISATKQSFEAVLDNEEIYSNSVAEVYQSWAPVVQTLGEFSQGVAKNANSLIENVVSIESVSRAKAQDTAASSKSTVSGLSEEACQDLQSAVADMV